MVTVFGIYTDYLTLKICFGKLYFFVSQKRLRVEELVNEVCNADVINVQHLQVKIQLIALA